MTSTTALDTDPPERPESPGAGRVATRIEQQLAAAQAPVAEALVRMTAELRRVADALQPTPACGAGSDAPNALGNERCTLDAGHPGRHGDGLTSWPNRADEGTWTAGAEVACCCICGIATTGTHRGAPFCSDCADCGCNQNPCVRLGSNDPAVSATPADCGPESAEQHTYASDCEAAPEPDACPTPETHNWGCACTTIHACPPDGSGLTPCCGWPPSELLADRMIDEPARVTCRPAPPVGALRDQLAEALMRSYAKQMKLREKARSRGELAARRQAKILYFESELRRARDLHADTECRLRDELTAAVERAETAETQLQQSRGGTTRLEPATENELRAELTAALLEEHQHRADQQIVAAPEDHCAALAHAVMPIVRFALDAWHQEHKRANQAEHEATDAHAGRQRAGQETDSVYRERAHLIALLAALYPAVMTHVPDADEDGWGLVFLDLPTGQASWHIAPRDADLVQHVELVGQDDPRAQWDGHATEEKYDRIRAYARMRAAEGEWPFADRQAEQQRQLTAAVPGAVPVLRRALEQLPETCRYHGDQLDPDHTRALYRSEACCDTGIPALRRRRAFEALASLTTTKES